MFAVCVVVMFIMHNSTKEAIFRRFWLAPLSTHWSRSSNYRLVFQRLNMFALSSMKVSMVCLPFMNNN